jgi:hypothetical protein
MRKYCRLSESLLTACFPILLQFVRDIQEAFLTESLRGRMCDMLVSVLLKLAGPRSLDLRVDNPERYHFRPEKMLQEIITIFLHFAPHPLFSNAVANSGFYQNGGKDLFAKVKSDRDVSCTLFLFHVLSLSFRCIVS